MPPDVVEINIFCLSLVTIGDCSTHFRPKENNIPSGERLERKRAKAVAFVIAI
jgi:hypothetical protein